MLAQVEPPTREQAYRPDPPKLTQAEEMLHEAKATKARIYEVRGRADPSLNSVTLDNDYLVIGSHVDETIRKKVASGEYIDFAKLLNKDKIGGGDEDV